MNLQLPGLPSAGGRMSSALTTSPTNELETSIRPVITRLQNGANAAAPAACSPEAVATLIGQFLPDDAAPVSDRSGRATSLAGARVLINGSYAPSSSLHQPGRIPLPGSSAGNRSGNRSRDRVGSLEPARDQSRRSQPRNLRYRLTRPDRILPGGTVSIRATGMNWLAKFPTIRLFARIGGRSVPIESNIPDPDSPGVSGSP